MESAYLLIPLSIVLLAGAVWAFWAVDRGQFDELEQQGDKILEDD
jgi:cbb3-type cytochrome oxidase maturation protein